MRRNLLVLGVALFAVGPLLGQGSAEDYRRAAALAGLTRNKVFRDRVEPRWLADGNAFWYRVALPDGEQEFVLVDATKGVREPAFDHAKLAQALATATGTKAFAARLPFQEIVVGDGTKAVFFKAFGKSWRFDRADHSLKEAELPPAQPGVPATPGGNRPPRRGFRGFGGRSPDGKWEAAVRDNNVFLTNRETNETTQLTREGKPEDGYGGPLLWSPRSDRLVVMRTKAGTERKVTIVESSPRDQLQPRVSTYDYRKPGDNVPIRKPHLFDVAAKKEIPVADTLFPNPYDLSFPRWEADGSRFTFVYNQRGHQVLRVVAVDAKAGETRALVDEQSKTFIDYAHKQYTHWIDQTNELIWMSERDGWNHLYLYDAKEGKVKNAITHGEWVVRSVDRVDDEKRQVWFQAGGIRPGQDPYYIHFCRVNFDGTGLVVLTEGDGTHEVRYSPDRRYFLDSYSRVDMPPVTELRRTEDGALVCLLEKADMSALVAAGWKVPERFVAKGRDGSTDIYGVIFRPTNFDPSRKYPIIEDIYAGPQGSFVPKSFRSFNRDQALAELGFILVKMDGMGTSNRSKAFHDVCWKNLGDSGFPDRILWIQAAAKQYPYMDTSRVGIFGGSAGGQSSTRAVLAHGDFYKVAVSDCGCHDNRMDKIWWNELWMGWPIGPHYKEQSNVTQAHRLTGKLLLFVGELDRNVDPASTMQLVNALIRANKDFDFVIFPGGGHGAGESPYGQRRRQDFFVRHLLGVEPRHTAAAE